MRICVGARFVLPVAIVCGAVMSSGPATAETIVATGSEGAAIGRAIAQSRRGDTVWLPAGSYAVDSAISPKSGTCLKGAGQSKTRLEFVGRTPSVIVALSGCEDIEICRMTLDGMSNSYATQGIGGADARRLNIHHVTIRNLVKGSGFGPHGILFSGVNPTRDGGVTDSRIADCRIENIAIDAVFAGGIRLAWGSSRNRVLRNAIANTGRGGIFGDSGSTDLVILHNTVTGSHGEGLGIEVWGGCDRAVIEDNRIDHWLSIGGSDHCAVRRNIIADQSGEYKFCGVEGIGSYCVITDNRVDGGQKIGLSVSGSQPKQYVFWGRNDVRNCNQWGAQFQGEAGGIACHYLFRCAFTGMPRGKGPVWYPGDEGHGFRCNGNVRDVVFEQCMFSGNGRLGLQSVGENVRGLDFVRCSIEHNKGAAIRGYDRCAPLDWDRCIVQGNADDALPAPAPYPGPTPRAAFYAPTLAFAGHEVRFRNDSKGDSGRLAAALWDFDDGPPLFQEGFTVHPAPVSHVFPKSGRFRVTLIVWDSACRAARSEHCLFVMP